MRMDDDGGNGGGGNIAIKKHRIKNGSSAVIVGLRHKANHERGLFRVKCENHIDAKWHQCRRERDILWHGRRKSIRHRPDRRPFPGDAIKICNKRSGIEKKKLGKKIDDAKE